MSIRPVEMNGLISRVQDVSTLKQNEDSKPLVDQNNFHNYIEKHIEHNQKQVREADDSDNHQKKYDAKEKGSNSYSSHNNPNKKKKGEDKKNQKKSKDAGFDIRI